ncbi:hypothetical protein N802_03920 [Knoellia sinensis KCTC 19936]|uniref:Uncharacterized protein n=1 Tax=Knoellia sinensis KCTC 19936 TaxID=1385520 RepID=A0A0A0J2G0_9MICO|nr:hypothetical protein N802_03920 [Knoellia sinensis KCTC 19936]
MVVTLDRGGRSGRVLGSMQSLGHPGEAVTDELSVGVIAQRRERSGRCLEMLSRLLVAPLPEVAVGQVEVQARRETPGGRDPHGCQVLVGDMWISGQRRLVPPHFVIEGGLEIGNVVRDDAALGVVGVVQLVPDGQESGATALPVVGANGRDSGEDLGLGGHGAHAMDRHRHHASRPMPRRQSSVVGPESSR